MFEPLGNLACSILADVDEKRVAARRPSLVTSGEIEGVAWLRATDQKRRIDASLLTENFEKYWNVRAEADERGRQAHLLQRARRLGPPGRTRRRLS